MNIGIIDGNIHTHKNSIELMRRLLRHSCVKNIYVYTTFYDIVKNQKYFQFENSPVENSIDFIYMCNDKDDVIHKSDIVFISIIDDDFQRTQKQFEIMNKKVVDFSEFDYANNQSYLVLDNKIKQVLYTI